jgi:hypothetical protein
VKVIRQPYLIDRLIVCDVSKDTGSNAGLACIYLNEFRVTACAFTLHSSESKVIKSWKEQLNKAKDLYEVAKSDSRRQALAFYNCRRQQQQQLDEAELLLDVELHQRGHHMGGGHHSTASSSHAAAGGAHGGRGSRISSIGQHSTYSASSSVELAVHQGGSVVKRNRSFEIQQQRRSAGENRASSLSSEEGLSAPTLCSHGIHSNTPACSPSCSTPATTPSPLKQQQSLPASAHNMGSYPSSPRPERRLTTGSSRVSPNTLTVQIPYSSQQQQHQQPSPPNTTSYAEQSSSAPVLFPSSASFSNSSPSARSRSPGPRGISYPPLSPKSLKRGVAIQQQASLSFKNPPTIAMGKGPQKTIPVITGVPPSPSGDRQDSSPRHSHFSASPEDERDLLDREDSFPDEDPTSPATPVPAPSKSRGRTDRNDPRRYHTAGAIEDIKKQDVLRNTDGGGEHGIQKRLSWNYGQHIPNNDLQLKNGGGGTSQVGVNNVAGSVPSGGGIKCLSSDSMQSSSGVSSTGSLQLSIGAGSDSQWGDHQQKRTTQQRRGLLEESVSLVVSPSPSLPLPLRPPLTRL